ncbi:hypothetical protein [Anabaena sp. PCC 7108]|uniref:hypothetical protein n=1 Tax=Anabaena sp. PCC 7108 TaxID=163908 RepID=UPI0003467680|nr:hypothetical protein [Anabaena sp. PCC 7108]
MIRIHAQEPSSIIPFSFIGLSGRKIRIIQARMWLLLAVPMWFAMSAIAPQNVQAYTARVDLGIESLPDENYETILGRAEMVARAAAQRSFDQDILVTDVSIIVTVQSHGLIAPVLVLDVSRVQWKQRPDPQRWVTYFKTARSLLLFQPQTELPDPAPAVSPTVNQPTPKTP